MLSLLKRFSVNYFVQPSSYFICVSHSIVSHMSHSIYFCFLSCLHSMVPAYMLRTQMEYDIKKSRIKETELLLSFSALERPILR